MIELESCVLPGVRTRALCGSYRVFEDRAAASGRTIDLRIVVLPSRARQKSKDPVLFLHGGPGAAATFAASMFAVSDLRDSRDIIDVMKHMVKLQREEVGADDIDHLGNRRVRSVGELLQNQIRAGLAEMEKTARGCISKMASRWSRASSRRSRFM